jgi:DNA/RNA endonuclease G (NUC1)
VFRLALAFAIVAFIVFQQLPLIHSTIAEAASSTVVISEFRTRGPNGAADEFVELYNITNSAINIGGWKINASNASGTIGTRLTITAGTTIPAHGHFLAFDSSASGGPYTGSVPGNQAFTTGITDDGGIAILDASNNIIDQVGMSNGSAYKEGTILPTQLTTNTNRSYERKPGDGSGSTQDTDNNAADFQLITPSDPQNLASASTPSTTPTNPSGTATASPASLKAGSQTTLTVNVTPGANPASTGIKVTGDLSSIGGSPAQVFNKSGNIFTFTATVSDNTIPGVKNIPITVADDQSRTSSTSIKINVQPDSLDHVVISQVYGGGGNAGSTYRNDFIELYNPTLAPVSLSGWSVQYASSAGTSWLITGLSGTIEPGTYYLVQEAKGAGGTTDLPTPNAVGTTAMSATDAKIALVDTLDPLSGACPGDERIVDFVGYGAANCFEGLGATPALTNTTSATRAGNGNVDTDSNVDDFTVGGPNPRSSTGGGGGGTEAAPFVTATTPAKNSSNVLVGANIIVNFSEPVDVPANGSWVSINCVSSGVHTAVIAGGPTSFQLDPNVDFANNEQCTVTISSALVSDQDTSDPPDQMLADYSWTFTTVSSTGIVRDPNEHLVMGNPSGATSDVSNENNYLMKKSEYALSYNRSRAIPNWTSWHLDSSWLGSQPRTNLFRADNTLPSGWYQVNETSFSGSGFDRGHMTPSGDRTFSFDENANTFLMTNMIPQAPKNNQVTWEGLESYSRQLVAQGNELYIISGGYGQGGIGSSGLLSTTVDQGRVVVPAKTWKVILVLPNGGGDDVSRVTTQTRAIAVLMPNEQGIDPDWHKYIVSVDEVEALTSYNFFSNVPEEIQAIIEANADGNTRPVANSQSVATQEDTPRTITLTATDAESNPLTYNVTGGPSHGTVSGTGNNVTYTPTPNYYGPDSFTFTASDKYLNSEAATVTINVTAVNDAPVVVNDDKSTPEDTVLSFPASDLTGNDNAGANEGDQTLTVANVITTPGTHGTVTLTSGQVTYTPANNYNGPASFDYQVCDDGTTNGASDSQCSNGTVNITIISVNDDPVAVNDSATTNEDTPVTIDVVANDTDSDGGTPALDSVSNPTNGSVSITNGKAVFSPDPNFHGVGGFSYVVSDGQGGTATGNVSVTINPVNDNPVANAGTDQTLECGGGLTTVTLNGSLSSDVDGDTLSYQWREGATVLGTGAILNTPLAFGQHTITLKVTDSSGGFSEDTVSIQIVDTTAPTITANGQMFSIWPPNKKYHTFNVSNLIASASDSCNSGVNLNSVVITKVTSDEGSISDNDIIIGANCQSVQLRADRNGNGDGRVYTITFKVSDAAGNSTTLTRQVIVPHDQGNGNGAIDSGVAYTVTSSCQ